MDSHITPPVPAQTAVETRRFRPHYAMVMIGLTAAFLTLGAGRVSSDIASAKAEISFDNVTASSGISYRGQSWGANWVDFNSDGRPDLWMSNHFGPATWYANEGGGTFRDVTSEMVVQQTASCSTGCEKCVNPAKCSNDTHGGAWADFDNDGDKDLVVLSGAGPRSLWVPDRKFDRNLFFINDGGIFRENLEAQNLVDRWHHGRTPLWVDIDNDGRLDLVSMAKTPSSDSNSQKDAEKPSTVFMQTDDGFEEIGEQAGFGPFDASQLPFAFLTDIAGKGRLQLVVKQESLLVYDISTLPFDDITDQIFPAGQITDPVKVDTDAVAADFNGDGLMDIYRTRIGSPGIMLINSASGLVDKTVESGLTDVGFGGKSVIAGDFDNDMDIDLYVVYTTEVTNQPNRLYANNGDGTFQVVPNAGGASGPRALGRGDTAVTADFDCDGFLDLFVTNGDWGLMGFRNSEGPYQLFRNRGNSNNWIQIDLVGTVSNRDGIGAIVSVEAGGKTQLREQAGGMHTKAQNHTRLHFGLGANEVIDRITVRWPSGILQTLSGQISNRVIEVTESEGESDISGVVACHSPGV